MPTQAQLTIAAQLEVQVSPDDTFAVVASYILEAVAIAIGCPPRDVSDRQHELAEELEMDISDCNSSWAAFVRIKEALQLSNLESVTRMELKPGDRVVEAEQDLQVFGEDLGPAYERIQREFEVSSIREDGQVFFKGGEQAPARYLTKLSSSN